MLYLRTLGGVYVARDGGPPLGGAAGQRRLLALLAILSVSGDSGMSRDRLVSLLWPDSDPEKGRHSLTQATYNARRTLLCDDLFVPGTDLRLNPASITSDVRDLETALAENDLKRAAALYTGAFLDDFCLGGNPDFEHWADSRRRQISERMARTFDRLAEQETESGDRLAVVEWRRRRLALDSLNSEAAIALVRSMAAAGDRTGALRQARVHQALLRTELDAEPAADLVALIASLATRPPSSAAQTVSDAGPNAVSPHQRLVARDTSISAQPRSGQPWRRFGFGFRLVALGVITMLLGTVAVQLINRVESRVTPHAPRFHQRIVVAPFRIGGADPALGFLREGLVELLSIRLNNDSSAGAVDPGALLRAWRRARVLDSADAPRADIVRVANGFGAMSVVLGSVVGDPSHLVITASWIDVGDSTVRVTASAAGPADSLATIVDRMAVKLLLASAGERERFANRPMLSLDALRAYLAGQEAYRQGSYAVAAGHYERALRMDSTFALAALRLALAADRLNAAEAA